MLRARPSTRITIAILGCATAIAAQVGPRPDRHAGYASFNLFDRQPVNVSVITKSVHPLGVQKLGNFIYVTGRGKGPVTVGPHTVYVFDLKGKLVRSFNQNPQTKGTRWGWRDMATDGIGLFAGFDFGIHFVDTTGKLVNRVRAKNGMQTLAKNPIPNPTGLTASRALAYNPEGNRGNGSLWVANFTSDLVEIDLNGSVLRRFPASTNTPRWWLYGLAWNPATKTLWGNSAPQGGPIREIDPSTGKYTSHVPIRRFRAGADAGGMCGIPGPNGSFSLLAMSQGSGKLTATMVGYRVDRAKALPGETEARMLNAVGPGPLNSSFPKRFVTTPQAVRMGFDTSRDSSLLGRPGALFLNFGPDAKKLGVTPGFPELLAIWPASIPPGAGVIILSTAVLPRPLPFNIPKLPFNQGDRIRMQMIYFEPKSPNFFVETNQVAWDFETFPVIVRAEGPNSFNSNENFGFFSVQNHGAIWIEEITFDWVGSSNQAHFNMQFDCDQGGLRNRFDAGNSKQAGCSGTYRNNSDVATGLIYDAQNTIKGVSCDASSNSGFIATNRVGSTGASYRTLKFRFANRKFKLGARFEFDCDTDFGGGIRGGDMEGMVVTIKLGPARTLKGELKKVSNNLSELKFR